MSKAPSSCVYCDGEGHSSAGGSCGFCIKGKPSDTQEDWDRTWGMLGIPHRLPERTEEEDVDSFLTILADLMSKPVPPKFVAASCRCGCHDGTSSHVAPCACERS